MFRKELPHVFYEKLKALNSEIIGNIIGKYLTDKEIANLKSSPKGVAVILKIVTQLALNVKYLNVQKEVVAGVSEQVDEVQQKAHGVSILMPVEVDNADDATDKG